MMPNLTRFSQPSINNFMFAKSFLHPERLRVLQIGGVDDDNLPPWYIAKEFLMSLAVIEILMWPSLQGLWRLPRCIQSLETDDFTGSTDDDVYVRALLDPSQYPHLERLIIPNMQYYLRHQRPPEDNTIRHYPLSYCYRFPQFPNTSQSSQLSSSSSSSLSSLLLDEASEPSEADMLDDDAPSECEESFEPVRRPDGRDDSDHNGDDTDDDHKDDEKDEKDEKEMKEAVSSSSGNDTKTAATSAAAPAPARGRTVSFGGPHSDDDDDNDNDKGNDATKRVNFSDTPSSATVPAAAPVPVSAAPVADDAAAAAAILQGQGTTDGDTTAVSNATVAAQEEVTANRSPYQIKEAEEKKKAESDVHSFMLRYPLAASYPSYYKDPPVPTSSATNYYAYRAPLEPKLPCDAYSRRSHLAQRRSSSSTGKLRAMQINQWPVIDWTTIFTRYGHGETLKSMWVRIDPNQVSSVLPYLFRTCLRLERLDISIAPSMTPPLSLHHGPYHEHNLLLHHAMAHRPPAATATAAAGAATDAKVEDSKRQCGARLHDFNMTVDPPICGAINRHLSSDLEHVASTHLNPMAAPSLRDTIVLDVDPRDRTAHPRVTNPCNAAHIVDAFHRVGYHVGVGVYHSRRCDRMLLEKAERRHRFREEIAAGLPDFGYQAADDDDYQHSWTGRNRTRAEEIDDD